MGEPLLLKGYRAATSLGRPLATPLLRWRLSKGKEDAARYAERYGEPGAARPQGPLIWIHAASVGETISTLPLMARILEAFPVSALLTTGTLTSARIAAARLPARALHQFVPLDSPPFVVRFLDHWRPGLAIFAESELWPNLIAETGRRGAGLALVNARMSERSFKGWQRASGAIAALLSRFDLCLAQSEEDAARLRTLGASDAVSTGNLKFDVPAPPAGEAELRAFSVALGERPCWTAASLHPGEDEIVIEAHRRIAAERPGLLTLLAPRHPERAEAIAELAMARGLSPALRSRDRVPGPGHDVLILDSIGELGLPFRLSPVVFMGGSLIAHGGQNPIEAAKLGTAILHGPHVANFADVYAALDDAGGAERIDGAETLAARVAALLADPAAAGARAQAAEAVVRGFGGALERTMDALAPLLARLAERG